MTSIKKKNDVLQLFAISDGSGMSVERVISVAMVQFPNVEFEVNTQSKVNRIDCVRKTVDEAKELNGIVFFTLVNQSLRKFLLEYAWIENVPAIDVTGPAIREISKTLKMEPVSEYGELRKLNQMHLTQAQAIEFSIAHDDGFNIDTIDQAEIVIVGVSRAGKTPLSIYLAVMGFKVANVPLVPEKPDVIHKQLEKIDRCKLFGLFINMEQLIEHRKKRLKRMNAGYDMQSYVSQKTVFHEIEAIRSIYCKMQLRIIDVTNKPIEASAREIRDCLPLELKKGKPKFVLGSFLD